MEKQFQMLVKPADFGQHGAMSFCRHVAAIFLTAATCSAHAQEVGKSFNLIVNGKPVGIDAGDTVTVKMPNGTDVTLKLERNPEVTFKGDGFSFRHSSDYQVSNSAPADDVTQHVIVTGSGTLVLVQAYKGTDPTSLTEFMLNQITSDDVQANAKLESAPHERIVANGMKLSGLKGMTMNSDESAEVEIMAARTGSGGIIAVSRIDRDNEETDRAFVEKFWSSLKPE